MGKLFGTDGARGVANSELTCELAMEIGRAAAVVLASHSSHAPKIVIGKDTRISSDMLEAALVAGLCSVGADCYLVGVVPTPAVAYLVGHLKADAGVMISASHNPCEYNGIKLFSGEGYKLPDEIEDEIEAVVFGEREKPPLPTGGALGRVYQYREGAAAYIAHLTAGVSCRLDGLQVALDCANGSACATAKELFESMGAKCHLLSDTPDGVNINAGCGSTHMENLRKYVKAYDLDLGLAFDGDADRCLAVDKSGEMVDGDQMMAIFACHMKEKGVLKNDTVVATVMSNLGFFRFAEENGLCAKTTAVGDRYVLEEMRAGGYSLGGEQSGHIIFLDHSTTGDGQLTGLRLMAVMKETGKTLSELAKVMTVYPQVLVNVKVGPDGKELFKTDEAIKAAIHKAGEELGKDGRILVRVSGTEPLIRVMAEGKCQQEIDTLAHSLADLIRERLS